MQVRPLLVALLASCFALSACGVKESPTVGDVAYHCKLIEKKDTGRTQYLGKANYPRIYRFAYICPTTIVFERY